MGCRPPRGAPRPGARSELVECRRQVVPQVLDVLDADRQPDQALGDGGRLGASTGGAARRSTRRRRGWWRAPTARSAGQQVGGERALGQHHRDDRAEARVADLADGRVLAPAGGPAPGRWPGPARAARAACAGRAAPARPRTCRGSRRSGRAASSARRRAPRRVVDERAQEHVAVPGDELGRRVHDEVGAERRAAAAAAGWRTCCRRRRRRRPRAPPRRRRRCRRPRAPGWSATPATPARRPRTAFTTAVGVGDVDQHARGSGRAPRGRRAA